MWKLQLIRLYCTVCDNHSTIEFLTQRLSNNYRPQFSDEECITVYLWGVMKRYFDVKAIYEYTKDHLLDWFPHLPSYQAFNYRLCRLAPALQALAEKWMDDVSEHAGTEWSYVLDSCPIVLAKQARASRAKVARELCDKGFNASKKEYYYGVKLHALGARHTGTIPTACAMMVSCASEHDLPAAKQMMETARPVCGGYLFADKAYIDKEWAETLLRDFNLVIVTASKKMKDDPIKSGDTFASFVSSFRQQIETFFNWLNENTNIQVASKVRSVKGLLVHIFGRIAAAIYSRYFNS